MTMSPMIDPSALTQFATAWSTVVLQVLIKGGLLLAAAGLFAAVLRRASASTRHLLWTLGIAGMLLLPALSLSLPSWRVSAVTPLLPELSGRFQPASSTVVQPERHASRTWGDPGVLLRPRVRAEWDARSTPLPAMPERRIEGRTLTSSRARFDPARLEGASVEPSSRPPISADVGPTHAERSPVVRAARAALGYVSGLPRTVWLFFAWEMGVLLVLLGSCVGAIRLWWLARTATPLSEPAWTNLVHRLATEMGIRGPLRVLRSSRAVTPMTWGLFRPVILLPLAAEGWTAAQRRNVLVHELAHVRRRDCLTQTLAHLACALYWFHPLVWIAARQMRVERERACDDQVLLAGSKASSYASHLLEMARSLKSESSTAFATVAMARRSQLSDRLLAVLDPRLRRVSPGRRSTALSVALASLVLLPLAAVQPATTHVDEARAAGAEPHRRAVRVAPPRAEEPSEPLRLLTVPAPVHPLREAPVSDPRGLVVVPQEVVASEAPRAVVPRVWRLGESYVQSAEGKGRLAVIADRAYVIAPDGAVRGLLATEPRMVYVGEDGEIGYRSFEAPEVTEAYGVLETLDLDGQSVVVADGTHWVYSDDDHKISVEIEGEVEFNEEGTDVVSMSEDAYFEIEEKRGRERRRVEILVGRDGEIEREYFVRGRRQDWDDEAQTWLAETLPQAMRNLGLNVDQRVAKLYEEGGVDAVLDEIRELDSDHVRSLYYREFMQLEQASPGDLARVLGQAARALDSDFEKANMLIASVETCMGDDELRQAYLETAATIDSDFERRRVFSTALYERDLSAGEMAIVLEAAEDMDSDFELAQLLSHVEEEHLEDPRLREAYFRAVRSLDSDFEQARVLKELLRDRNLDREGLVFALECIDDIDSDFESANLLTLAAGLYLDDDELRELFFDAVGQIDSDFERGRVLGQLIHEADLSEASQLLVLDNVDAMDSDFERVNLLVMMAKRGLSSDAVRDAYLEVTDDIDSDFEYGRAMKALRRAEKGAGRGNGQESR